MELKKIKFNVNTFKYVICELVVSTDNLRILQDAYNVISCNINRY